ncbi:hypothetical protein RA280_16475 [Cupriavidus sp. CV2]|uniref:hypothetical protein n=1 Tax=Cupriavidus ulmosensis TaxID=3065913 RepID=UPI00296A8FAD|nr:hypothetical protein [Cupriavidus sp. CV2]MDW3683316.1 hypothetical protein [Cupriavidus sp. CV2]
MKLLTRAIVAKTIVLTLGAAATFAHAVQGDYPYEKNARIAGAWSPYASAGRSVTNKHDPFVDGSRSFTASPVTSLRIRVRPASLALPASPFGLALHVA